SSDSKRASALRANHPRQNSTTAALPSIRRPSGAGDVSSNTVSSVSTRARASASWRLNASLKRSMTTPVDSATGFPHSARRRVEPARGPVNGPDQPFACVTRQHHQLRAGEIHGITVEGAVVLGGGDRPCRIVMERHTHRRTLARDLALELDIRWQVVGLVLGAGFELP